MRILQVGPVPPEVGGQTQGGVATHLWDLSAYLVKKGHTVGVLGSNTLASELSHENKGGIQLFGFMGIKKLVFSGKLFTPKFWINLRKIKKHFQSLMTLRVAFSGLLNYQRVIDQFQPDIIHVHHLENRFPFVYYLVEEKFLS